VCGAAVRDDAKVAGELARLDEQEVHARILSR
jgi:hypothetical protein